MSRTVIKEQPAITAASASPIPRPHEETGGGSTAERSGPVLTEQGHHRRQRVRTGGRWRDDLIPVSIGLVVGLVGWASGGRAVAIPLGIVAVLSVQAALIDARTLRIPNQLVVAGLGVVLAGIPLVALVDHRPLGVAGGAAVVGWCLSGSPIMFGLWWVRPAGLGGGDWKVLSVQGLAVGLLAPLAAPLILLVATVVQLVQSIVRRRRQDLPLAPGLAAGYIAAIAFAVVFYDLLGGAYT